MKSQGPSFVPWGTPGGTVPHWEKQSLDSFTRWRLFIRKSQTQRAILPKFWQLECHDLPGRRPFCNPSTPRAPAELVPSVACAHVCTIETRACRFEKLGIAPNWLWSIDSKNKGSIYLLTTRSSANLDRAGVGEIGRTSLAMLVTGLTFVTEVWRRHASRTLEVSAQWMMHSECRRPEKFRSHHSPEEANC